MNGEIKVDNVKFSYRSDDGEGEEILRPAVRGASLEIHRGEYVAVIGPNGSGKSTLAKLIDVLELPDEGTITVFGTDTRNDKKFWEIRENCAVVFQNPDNQIVGTTVEEDVAFGPENLGVPLPELRERVDKALKDVGLYELRTRQAASLSGGQKQKLAIAGCLAMRPQILIMDESTAMLDPVSRDEVLEIVEQMRKRDNLTLITITHDMSETVRCDKIFVVKEGKVILSGTPAEVFLQDSKTKAASLALPPRYALVKELGRLTQTELAPEDFASIGTLKQAAVRCIEKGASYKIEPPEQKQSPDDKVIMSVKDLSFAYEPGAPKALDNINLDVYEGEVLAIAGQSGCGKTTLISHFNGIIRPQTGTVTVDGMSTADNKLIAKIRQNIGLVFQYPEYQLFAETVYKDIRYGISKNGLSEDEERKRIEKACDIVGFDKTLLESSPFDLSGGQKRRAAMAGVLVMQPKILVLDEPASGLDPKGRADMFSMIRDIKKSGVTVVIVSHYMDEAAVNADRICYMKDGRIEQIGTPHEVFANPNVPSPVIKAFRDDIEKAMPEREFSVPGDFTPEGEARALLAGGAKC